MPDFQLQAWIERLYRDFEHVCFTYRARLDPPVIEVTDLGRRWGLWDPVTRTLSLSRRLIQEYPWDVVVEILKHEMAHQWVNEVMESSDVHGSDFQKACGMLGVADWARRAESEISELRTVVESEPEDETEKRLRDRIEKLLSLANSSNEHEAYSAMQKVQEIYEKYHLGKFASSVNRNYTYGVIRTKRQRLERTHYAIGSLLNDFFYVRVVHTTHFDPAELCESKAIELLGTRENVLMAEYVFHFLLRQIDSLWAGHLTESRRSVSKRLSFQLGILSGFREKLTAETKRREEVADDKSSHQALIVLSQDELDGFVETRFPRLVTLRGGRRRHDSRLFEAGKKQGLKLVLHRALGETQRTDRVLFLTK